MEARKTHKSGCSVTHNPEQYVGIARIASYNRRRDAPEYRVFRNSQNQVRNIRAPYSRFSACETHGDCVFMRANELNYLDARPSPVSLKAP